MATANPATMILVPGAMHGKWTWDRVTPLLQAAGYRVIAPDLPGMGPDPGIASEQVTLASWADFIADLVRGVDGPVILAGHSRGGLVIGEAAERVPENLAGLIYITAMIVLPGQTGMTAGRDATAQPAATPAPAFTPERAKAIFYKCCTPADADWAVSRLEPEPPAPLNTPAEVTWARWGQVPRAYIECRQDQTLSLARQRRFQGAAPCDPVIQLDTDHSPFLSTPRELADAMVQIAAGFLRSEQLAHPSC
jgi:pimeloyl-ACP methyl ester carboxylesterase